VAVLAISLQRSKIGQRLLLTTNGKLHTRRYALSIGTEVTTLDDLERPPPTLLHNKMFFKAHHKNLNEDRPILSAAKM